MLALGLDGEVQFDWDQANLGHLRRHKVSAEEFEQVVANAPLDLNYEVESGEERYSSLGATDTGRILVAVWTMRGGTIRAVTAYPASKALRKLYLEFGR